MDREKNSNGQSQAQHRGLRVIADVVALTRYCSGYLRDQRDRRSGWTIYYAIDADVVGMFMAPDRKAEYGAVFHGQDDEAALLTRLIGDFIFRELRSEPTTRKDANIPLLMMQPHDQELGRMLFALSRRLTSGIKKTTEIFVENSALSNQLQSGDVALMAQWLIEHAPELIELFDGQSGPRLEVDRFNTLEHERLLNLQTYSAQEGWSSLLPCLDGTSKDLDRFGASVAAWKELLNESRAKRYRSTSLVSDAFALAMLEWINARFETEGQKRRLVLVTGTQAILNATMKRSLKPSNSKESKFAERYVRHPQAFMADHAFFAGIGKSAGATYDESFDLIKWLNLCLPHVMQRDRTQFAIVDIDLLEDLHDPRREDFGAAAKLLHVPPAASTEFSILDEWRDLINVVSVARQINRGPKEWPPRATNLINSLTQRAGAGATVHDLRKEITAHAFESLSTLCLSAEWLGVWAQVETVQEYARGIPVLRFSERFATAQKYCEVVTKSMRPSGSPDLNTGAWESIGSVYANMAKFDSSNYLSHTIHALAYATKGHWYATRTLCQIAIQTTDRLLERERGERRGREAAYLLTIAERRLASVREDLRHARDSLQQAIVRGLDDSTAEKTEDVRFRSEALAIDVAEKNFTRFVNKELILLAREFDAIHAEALRLLDDLEREKNPEVKRWVLQQVMTNVLDLALVLRSQDSPIPAATEASIRAFVKGAELWMARIGAGHGVDAISKFIFTAAAAIYSEAPERRNRHRQEFTSLDYPAARRFDEERKKIFKRLVVESGSRP